MVGSNPPGERVTALAIALALGIAIGWWQPAPLVWPWLVVAAGALAAAGFVARRGRGWILLLGVATGGLGAAWVNVRLHYVAGDDLAAWVGARSTLVRFRGVALGPPVLRDRSGGSLARFDHRPPATYFPLRVEAVLGRDGTPSPVRGRVLVRVDETVAPFSAGARIDAVGILRGPSPPLNPGEFDYGRYARSRGQAGLLEVTGRDLLTVRSQVRAWPGWRQALRRRATAWLLADLPESSTPRDALLEALLLGRRGPELERLQALVRRVGLAHFLAISGLHLGVLAGFALLLARLAGLGQQWHGWLTIAVVVGYLVLVEVRMPVLRAGVMTLAACAGMVCGRRYRVSGLVSLSGIGLLLWRPQELMAPGFQLSYGVVLGLIHLAPRVRARWFGAPDALAASSAEMLGQWLRGAAAVAVTAWAVATPITMYHWGVVWPWAAAYSLLALPIVAAVLAVGYLKMLAAVFLPSAALLLGVPLSFCAEVLVALVGAMAAVPGSVVAIPQPAPLWSVLAGAWVCGWGAWGLWPRRWRRRVLWSSGAILLGWFLWPLVWPLVPGGAAPALRIDMLAVGDGSCYLLRSGRAAILFDAGSSNLDAGRRVIVPALRRLGVRRLDAVVISHPNSDHYSAVLEVADGFDLGSVLVTPQFIETAESDPRGPVAFVLDGLLRRFVPVAEVAAGKEMVFGSCRLRWLHPDRSASWEHVNDGSMVIRVEAAGRVVLLCGDIQREAMSVLLDPDRAVPLAADIVELPHHGSHHGRAEGFVAGVGPEVVMQSAGRSRFERFRGRWAEPLAGVERLVTARDGACWVVIDPAGTITVGRFLASRP